MIVRAQELQGGDVIKSMDNAEVIEAEIDTDGWLRDRHNCGFSRGKVVVTMEQEGEEFYLLLPPDLAVEVWR